MSEYQVMRWREIPSMVISRSGQTQIKVALPARFQEAIDEAAMRLGATGADDYVAGWARDPWVGGDEEPDLLAARITAELEAEFSEAKLGAFLDSLAKASE